MAPIHSADPVRTKTPTKELFLANTQVMPVGASATTQALHMPVRYHPSKSLIRRCLAPVTAEAASLKRLTWGVTTIIAIAVCIAEHSATTLAANASLLLVQRHALANTEPHQEIFVTPLEDL